MLIYLDPSTKTPLEIERANIPWHFVFKYGDHTLRLSFESIRTMDWFRSKHQKGSVVLVEDKSCKTSFYQHPNDEHRWYMLTRGQEFKNGNLHQQNLCFEFSCAQIETIIEFTLKYLPTFK